MSNIDAQRHILHAIVIALLVGACAGAHLRLAGLRARQRPHKRLLLARPNSALRDILLLPSSGGGGPARGSTALGGVRQYARDHCSLPNGADERGADGVGTVLSDDGTGRGLHEQTVCRFSYEDDIDVARTPVIIKAAVCECRTVSVGAERFLCEPVMYDMRVAYADGRAAAHARVSLACVPVQQSHVGAEGATAAPLADPANPMR